MSAKSRVPKGAGRRSSATRGRATVGRPGSRKRQAARCRAALRRARRGEGDARACRSGVRLRAKWRSEPLAASARQRHAQSRPWSVSSAASSRRASPRPKNDGAKTGRRLNRAPPRREPPCLARSPRPRLAPAAPIVPAPIIEGASRKRGRRAHPDPMQIAFREQPHRRGARSASAASTASRRRYQRQRQQ